MWSAPSSSMIAVPDAALLPSRPRPAAARSGCVIAGGKPSGNVAIACLVTSPAISQWPVIVSLPAEASRITPHAARGAAASRTPAIAVRLPRPIACRLGSPRPPAARAVLPSVSAPASPYSAASGAPPQPTPSATMMMTRVKLPMTRSLHFPVMFPQSLQLGCRVGDKRQGTWNGMKTGDRKAGISRRTVVQGAAAASATSLLGFLGCDKAAPPPARPGDATAALELGFTPVPTSRADTVVVPRGYRQQVLSAWGDPVVAGAGAFSPDADAAAQAAAAGMGHDGMAFFPLPPSPSGAERGLLAVNYEYTDDGLLHPNGMEPWTADKVAKSKAAHGVGIIEIAAAEDGSWRVVPGSLYRPAHHGRHADRARGPGGGARMDEDRRRPRRADRARHVQQLRVRQDAVGDVPDLRGERRGVLRPGLRRGHAPATALRRRPQQGRVGLSAGRSSIRASTPPAIPTSPTATAGSSRSIPWTRSRRP